MRKKNTLQAKENLAGYLFLLPAIIGFLIFIAYPFVYSLVLSLQKTAGAGITNLTFAGFAQYQKALGNPEFWNSLVVTMQYTFPTVLLQVALGLACALLVNRKLYGKGAIRALIFVPVVLSNVVVAIVWRFMLSPDVGLFNRFLAAIGLPGGTAWLSGPGTAIWGVIIVGVWKWIGYHMVIYLAGLQDIPSSMYESAALDGAGPVKRFVYITLPMLSGTTGFLIITSVINTFQVFDQVYMMTQGGPIGSTDVIVYYIYRHAFEFYDMPYASAVSWLLFVVIFALTFVQMAVQNRRGER